MLVGARGIKRALFKGRGQVLSGRFYSRFILKHYRVTLSVPIVRFRMRVGVGLEGRNGGGVSSG